MAEAGKTITEELASLVQRIREEVDYNRAKGRAPYRMGLHDGLRFAEDAIVDLLARHGHAVHPRPTELDA